MIGKQTLIKKKVGNNDRKCFFLNFKKGLNIFFVIYLLP